MLLASFTHLIYAILAIWVVFFLGFVVLFSRCYRRVQQGQALIRTGAGGARVSFTGIFSIPPLHKCETVDLTNKKLIASFRDENALQTRDGETVDVVAAFLIEVERDPETILKIAGEHGADRANTQETLEELFLSRFSDALSRTVRDSDFQLIDERREEFRAKLRETIGPDLKDYSLKQIALDHFGRKA